MPAFPVDVTDYFPVLVSFGVHRPGILATSPGSLVPFVPFLLGADAQLRVDFCDARESHSSRAVPQVLQLSSSDLADVDVARYLETGGEGATIRPVLWVFLLFLGPFVHSISYQWFTFIAVSNYLSLRSAAEGLTAYRPASPCGPKPFSRTSSLNTL